MEAKIHPSLLGCLPGLQAGQENPNIIPSFADTSVCPTTLLPRLFLGGHKRRNQLKRKLDVSLFSHKTEKEEIVDVCM